MAQPPTGKFEGRVWWMDRPTNRADHLWVRDILVSSSRISFDLPDHGDGNTVAVGLTPVTNGQPSWTGTYRYTMTQSVGDIDARMYMSVDDCIVLAGMWKEDGKELDWFVEMSPQPGS